MCTRTEPALVTYIWEDVAPAADTQSSLQSISSPSYRSIARFSFWDLTGMSSVLQGALHVLTEAL